MNELIVNRQPTALYRCHKIWVVEEIGQHWWWKIVEKADGTVVTAPINPYDDSVGTVKLWIDAGYPAYNSCGNSGNWDRAALMELMRPEV